MHDDFAQVGTQPKGTIASTFFLNSDKGQDVSAFWISNAGMLKSRMFVSPSSALAIQALR